MLMICRPKPKLVEKNAFACNNFKRAVKVCNLAPGIKRGVDLFLLAHQRAMPFRVGPPL